MTLIRKNNLKILIISKGNEGNLDQKVQDNHKAFILIMNLRIRKLLLSS